MAYHRAIPIAAVLSCLALQPVWAQPETPQPLQLEEVLTRVERYHPKLLGTNLERRIASAKRLEKQGAFDPAFTAASEYLEYNSTSSRGRFASAFQNTLSFEFPTRTGIKYAVGARYNIGNVKSPLSSTGDTGEYFVAFSVPLLRGLGLNEKVVAERQAELGEPLSAAQLVQTRQQLKLKAASSYWDWVAAGRKLLVARQLLALAQQRAEAVGNRIGSGDLPSIDAVEANQEVQLRRGDLVKAERDAQKEAFKLSLYLWQADGNPPQPPDISRLPVTLAEPVALPEGMIDTAQQQAIERRPELQQLQLLRESARLDLALAENQRLPGIDLYLSPGIDTGTNSVGATFKFGVAVSLPLAQRTADGLIAQAQLKMQKIDLDSLDERQRILTDVADSAAAIDAAYERYRNAEQEVQLAIQLEQGERDRFALGDSTLFLVNQRERAAASARTRQIDAQADYERALATFRAATGQF
ncbi:TolC family protein [Gloeobacter kilaueensis]|uniref:Outer membrane efflux protein n=1 Tax=Gloeobacter kilaueensis (strain ATCC BAA-2537 / CCAP 1431/1 / ULC 316 / JS1) TaxID=1183438 RepID=U5QJD2_GLOK1|nr:TolC family protein [Gloeobacter kilaueensis]AGY57780.1 outer membrane efflux protein [Gloeobacter kilaueensis JS1]